MRQIFLDTETTGLNPESGDRIVEIGCIEMVNRRLTGDNRHFYLNPERPGHEDAIRVHGLTDVTVHTDSAGPDFLDEETGIHMQTQDFRVSFNEAR